MTLGPHLDLVVPGDQVVRHFCPVQGQVEEVGMEVEAEWVEAWASWEDLEDQEVASLDGGHHLALHPMLDLTTSWALEECPALEVEVAVGEEAEVVDSPLEALHSSICPQTSVHPCTLDQDLIPCCPQAVWEVPGEGDHLTHGLACLHSSNSMDRVDIHSTAPHYLVVEALGALHMVP